MCVCVCVGGGGGGGVVGLKKKKGIIIDNTFQKILAESGRKPNKIWLGQSSDSGRRSVNPW